MKPFCYWHVATAENPEGTDCAAHLAEARVFVCGYTPKDVQEKDGRLRIPGCPDYEPLKR